MPSRFAISPRAPLDQHWPAVSLLTLLLILSISHVYFQLAYPLHAVGLCVALTLLAVGTIWLPESPDAPAPETGGDAHGESGANGARRRENRRNGGARSGVARFGGVGNRPSGAAVVARRRSLFGYLVSRECPAPYRAFLGVQAVWVAWNAVALWRAPVRAFGREAFVTVFLGGLVFLIVAEAVRRWGSIPSVLAGDAPCAPDDGEGPQGRARPSASALSNLSPAVILGGWWAGMGVLLGGYGVYQVLGPAGWPNTFATLLENLLSAYPAAQGGDAALLGPILHALAEKRAFSTFGAPNMFGGFLVGALPFLIVGAVAGGDDARARRVASVLGAAVCLWALVLSQSRGGMLAAVVSGVYLAIRFGGMSPRWRRLAAVAGTAALLVALHFGAGRVVAAKTQPNATPETEAVAAQAMSEIALGASEASKPVVLPTYRTWTEHLLSISTVRQRVYYWHTALILWSRTPFVGAGLGGFEVHYPSLRRSGGGETIYAHNWFFHFGSETGMVGVGLFLALLSLAAWGARETTRRCAVAAAAVSRPSSARFASPAVLLAFEAALLGMVLHGLVDYTTSHRELYFDTQLLLGLFAGGWAVVEGRARLEASAVEKTQATKPEGERRARRSERSVGRGRIEPLAAGGAGLLLLVVCATVVVPSLFSRFYLTAGRDAAAGDRTGDTPLVLFEKALAWEPDNPWALSSLGMIELERGRRAGLDRIHEALRLHPRSASLHRTLATAHDRLGQPEQALDALRRAVELHPLHHDHRLDLAERLLSRGLANEAREHVGVAARLPLATPLHRHRIERLEERLSRPSSRGAEALRETAS